MPDTLLIKNVLLYNNIDATKGADILINSPSFKVQYTIIAGNTVYRKKN